MQRISIPLLQCSCKCV